MQEKTKQILTWVFLAAAIVWGGYVTFYYMGVPAHRAVLLSEADTNWVSQQCEGTFCQGVYALEPFIRHLLTRMNPIAWYGVVAALVYAGFAGYQWFTRRGSVLRLELRPWYFAAGFVAAVWVLFTVFSVGAVDGFPMKRLVEPSPAVYRDVPEKTLAVLKENFTSLQAKRCLTYVGNVASGTGIYDMKGFCVQRFFWERVFTQMLVAGVFLFLLLIAGHSLLKLFRVRMSSLLAEGLLSVGLGSGVWIAALWFVSLMGAFTPNVGWSLLIAVTVLCYRSAWDWLVTFWKHTWTVELRLWSPVILITFALVSYLALNFLFVIRPFPIGWDDLGSYINRPRLLVSYGKFIPSMATFQWEYLTSLGFLLFGYTSYFGATAAMIINWTQGLLATLVVWLFGRTYLGRGRGLLAALLYYTLPLVGHFSFADMKIDNAVFFAASLATFAAFAAIRPPEDHDVSGEDSSAHWRSPRAQMIFLAGIFGGLALGFKVTSVMVTLSLLTLIGGMAGWFGAVGGALVGVFAMTFAGGLNLARIAERVWGVQISLQPKIFGFAALLLGACFFAVAWRRAGKQNMMHVLRYGAMFLAGVIAAAVPWLAYNNYRAGRIIPLPLFTVQDTISPTFLLESKKPGTPDLANHHYLPPELALDQEHPACKSTAMKEELDRYWGNGSGWSHYLLLPWRSVMNLDAGGYYVTVIPALLLFPLLLLLPVFWDGKKRWLQYLCVVTGFIVVQWIFLANGVPWYGVGMFFGLTLALEALLAYAPSRSSRIVMGIIITLSLLIAFGMRFWQFSMQQNLLEYPLGKIDGAALERRTIPYYADVAAIALERHAVLRQQPFVYRVGTFIPYFVPKNLEVLGVADHQLSFFNCLYQERDPQLTLKRLIALGFNSVIFDTNTATIESDPKGTLHQKVNAFVDFLNTPDLGVRILVNDPNAGIAYVLLPPIQ